MRRLGSQSWMIGVDRCNQLYEFPLWIRAAERIAAPPDPFVPGPLELDPLPEPSVGPDADLGPAWLDWWRTVIGLPRWTSAASAVRQSYVDFCGPDALGLARWPELRRVAVGRWPQAQRWHHERDDQDAPRRLPPSPNMNEIVRAVERDLGRPLRPIRLDLIVLPVRDGTVRRVSAERYLVPERVFDGPRFPEWLREELRRLG